MSKTTYPIKGACQCGTISYELLAAPIKVIACHCKECQTLSTSAFSITTIVEAESIRFSGETHEWERSSDSGNINRAHFCPTCGNRIYHINPLEPNIIKLKGRLENSKGVNPTSHIWLSEKQDWYEVPENIPQHDKQPF